MTGADLSAVVAAIWARAGFDTTVEERGGETYVIASRDGSVPADLVLLAPDGVDGRRVEAFAATVSDLAVDTAYVVSDGALTADARRRARTAGIVPVGPRDLSTLVAESGVATPVDDPDGRTPSDGQAGGRTRRDQAESGPEDESSTESVGDGEATDGDDERELSHIESIRRKIGESTETDDADDDEADALDADADATGGLGDPTGFADLEGTGDGDGESDGTDATDLAGVGDDAGSGDDDGGPGYITFDDDADETDLDVTGSDGDPKSPPRSDRRSERGGDDGDGRLGDVLPERVTRRRLIATVAGVSAVGLADHFVFNLVLGGGGAALPAYNETSVKANAASIPPKSVLQNVDALAQSEQPVTYEGVVGSVSTNGGLVHFSLVTGAEGQTVSCRYDGEAPTTGARVTVWGVVTGTTTLDDAEVVTVDVVDLQSDGNDGGTADGESEGTTARGTESTTGAENEDVGTDSTTG